MSDIDVQFAQAVRQFRRGADLTQTWVAKRMSERGFPWHQQTVNKVERGERPLRISEAVTLAAVLRVDLASLLAGDFSAQVDLAAENAALRRTLAVIRAALDGTEAAS